MKVLKTLLYYTSISIRIPFYRFIENRKVQIYVPLLFIASNKNTFATIKWFVKNEHGLNRNVWCPPGKISFNMFLVSNTYISVIWTAIAMDWILVVWAFDCFLTMSRQCNTNASHNSIVIFIFDSHAHRGSSPFLTIHSYSRRINECDKCTGKDNCF